MNEVWSSQLEFWEIIQFSSISSLAFFANTPSERSSLRPIASVEGPLVYSSPPSNSSKAFCSCFVAPLDFLRCLLRAFLSLCEWISSSRPTSFFLWGFVEHQQGCRLIWIFVPVWVEHVFPFELQVWMLVRNLSRVCYWTYCETYLLYSRTLWMSMASFARRFLGVSESSSLSCGFRNKTKTLLQLNVRSAKSLRFALSCSFRNKTKTLVARAGDNDCSLKTAPPF